MRLSAGSLTAIHYRSPVPDLALCHRPRFLYHVVTSTRKFDMNSNSELIREMIFRADMRLQAQQQIVLASDARAMQFTVICIAAATLAATLGSRSDGWGHYATAMMLVVASFCSAWAARTIKWNAPGMHTGDFKKDLVANRPLDEVRLDLAIHLDELIDENESILKENASSLQWATGIAVFSPIIGAVIHFLF